MFVKSLQVSDARPVSNRGAKGFRQLKAVIDRPSDIKRVFFTVVLVRRVGAGHAPPVQSVVDSNIASGATCFFPLIPTFNCR